MQTQTLSERLIVLPGPLAREIVERDVRYVSLSYGRAYPFVMSHGRGSEVWDVDGNRFIDFMAGIAVTSTGHCHPVVVQAIKDALLSTVPGLLEELNRL